MISDRRLTHFLKKFSGLTFSSLQINLIILTHNMVNSILNGICSKTATVIFVIILNFILTCEASFQH